MDYRVVLGVIATVIGLIGYIPYFRDILAKKTKPHVFSWFIWGLLTAIAFIAQLLNNAGPGSWVNGLTAIFCLSIAAISIKYGTKDIKRVDVVCFALSIIAIILWIMTNNALLAVILVTIADLLGFIPTFRKAYAKPFEETLSSYYLSSTKYLISLFALTAFTSVNVIFPFYLVIANAGFGIFSYVRRKQVKNK